MKPLKFSISVLVMICLGGYLVVSCNSFDEKHASVSNGKIKFEFDPATGALLTFRDLARSVDFLDDSIPGGTPWEIALSEAFASDTLTIYSASRFSYSLPDSLSLLLEWDNFRDARYRNLKVTAAIRTFCFSTIYQ